MSCRSTVLAVVVLSLVPIAAALPLGTGDFDENGFINRFDYVFLKLCATVSGPGIEPPIAICREVFDMDGDADVDLIDFAAYQRIQGHLPIMLKDALGNAITVDSTRPYSGRQTCGRASGCHDVHQISNGFIHQQGRTDADGHMVMNDDFMGDGRWWVRSAGMFGRWSGGGGGLNRQTAGKHNMNESEMDMTAFYGASHCGGCHAGGGGLEFDRDGLRYYDESTGLFGYELLGLQPQDVLLDGDYALIDDDDGSLHAAPWDVTGVAEPDCLLCHRRHRTGVDGLDMHREWRGAILATTTELVDDVGHSVPAFAAAATAGQGWFTRLDVGVAPPVLQLDYAVGVDRGELVPAGDDALALDRDFLVRPPRDRICWGCHLPGGFQNKRGAVWFDERDIHYRKFTNRNDDVAANDVADDDADTCNLCHPGDINHNFGKGNSPYTQFRNELDWALGFRSCRECRLTEINGQPNLIRHPDAPDVPGETFVHNQESDGRGPMVTLSCQACHVPFALKRAVIVTDRSVTGDDIFYFTDDLLSANPLDPADPDKSTWYPSLVFKTDSDGAQRLFPQKQEIAVYWGDWDQNGTPDDLSDDIIQPVILWRLRRITGALPLPGVTDDNGDGKLEINRPEEMLVYMSALKGIDTYGRTVASRPVLIKGPRVWYEDAASTEGVNSFEYKDTGIAVTGYEVFGLDHNVLAKENAWGYNMEPSLGCEQCHQALQRKSPVLDRLVLVDPFDAHGAPVYATVRELTGVNPP
ncbi:MAG: hypothetical protein HOP29_08165 [Phycisphaerales bacterium]|nr:hypothetical protein [Phycisphaerales bacterium]